MGRIIVTKVKCWSCIPWQCSISISDEDKEGYCDTELQSLSHQITSDTFSTFINVLYNKLFSLIHIININNTYLTTIIPSNPATPASREDTVILFIKTISMIFTFTFPQSSVVGCGSDNSSKTAVILLPQCTRLDPYRLSVVIRWD